MEQQPHQQESLKKTEAELNQLKEASDVTGKILALGIKKLSTQIDGIFFLLLVFAYWKLGYMPAIAVILIGLATRLSYSEELQREIDRLEYIVKQQVPKVDN